MLQSSTPYYWDARHNGHTTFMFDSRKTRNVQYIKRSNLWDANTVELQRPRLAVLTHETSSTLRGATYGLQNKRELRHSCLIAATHETSSPLRRATCGMQKIELRRACLVVETHETSITMRGAREVILQHHQILRLPQKMTSLMLILLCAEQQKSPSNIPEYWPRKITFMLHPLHT